MTQERRTVTGDLDAFLAYLDGAITAGSLTASLEASDECTLGGARMGLRVYERYSALGGNRLSLTVAALADEGRIELSVVTSGGSQAMFWKVNTLGEDAFLEHALVVIDAYSG